MAEFAVEFEERLFHFVDMNYEDFVDHTSASTTPTKPKRRILELNLLNTCPGWLFFLSTTIVITKS